MGTVFPTLATHSLRVASFSDRSADKMRLGGSPRKDKKAVLFLRVAQQQPCGRLDQARIESQLRRAEAHQLINDLKRLMSRRRLYDSRANGLEYTCKRPAIRTFAWKLDPFMCDAECECPRRKNKTMRRESDEGNLVGKASRCGSIGTYRSASALHR